MIRMARGLRLGNIKAMLLVCGFPAPKILGRQAILEAPRVDGTTKCLRIVA